MKRASSRLAGLGFSSVSAENKREVDGAVGGGPCIQRVDDVVGLAEPQRQADHETGSDLADDVVDNSLGVGKLL